MAGGATYIFLGKVLAYLIGFAGSVITLRLLGAEVWGFVTVAMLIPGIFGIAGDFGVGQATIRFVAESRAKSKGYEAELISSGLGFNILTGLLGSFLALSVSGWLTSEVFGKPEVASLARLAAVVISSNFLYSWSLSVFTGMEEMEHVSLMLVVLYIAQSVAAPLLIVLGFGATGAIIAYILGPFLGSLVGIAMVARKRLFRAPSFRVLKTMLRYGVPLAIGSTVLGLQDQFLNFLLATFSSTFYIGNYGAVLRFSIFYDIIMTPILTVLFPALSRFHGVGEAERIKLTFTNSVRYSSLLMIPIGLGAIVISRPLTLVLLGSTYTEAWFYLILLAVGWLYVGAGVVVVRLILASQGETHALMRFSVVGAVTGITLGAVLIPRFGPVGLFVSGLLSPWSQFILMYLTAKTRYGIRLPIREVSRIYLASILAVLPALFLALIPLSETLQVIFGVLTATLAYPIMVTRLRALDEMDVAFLKRSLGVIPIVGKPFTAILKLIERLLP